MNRKVARSLNRSGMTLSVIMPALNEEANIADAISASLSALEKHGITGEIIVINDGSEDRTHDIVKAIVRKKKRVRLIDHVRPMGIGASFIAGVKSSQCDIVVMFPGDNENDPDDALSFYAALHDVDILVPFVHNVEVRDRSRRLISSLYRFIINMSFGTNFNYTNGTVFYRRVILEGIELTSLGFFYQAELLIKLVRKGYLFAETPAFLATRSSGKSKATTFRSFCKVAYNYIRLMVEIHIKRNENARKTWHTLHKKSISYRKYYEKQNKDQ